MKKQHLVAYDMPNGLTYMGLQYEEDTQKGELYEVSVIRTQQSESKPSEKNHLPTDYYFQRYKEVLDAGSLEKKVSIQGWVAKWDLETVDDKV